MAKRCGQWLYENGVHVATCNEPWGTEHSHHDQEPGKDSAGMERLSCAKCGLEITPNDKVKIVTMDEVATKDTDILVAHDICPKLTPA